VQRTGKPRVLLVTNMYPTSADPARGVFVERLVRALNQLLTVPVQVVLVGRTGAGGFLRSRRAVVDAVRAFNPDVLHVYYGLSAAAVPASLTLPTVVTLCGSDLLQWKHRRTLRGLVEYVFSVWVAKRASVILVQSLVMRDALPRTVPRDRIKVEPPGIDLGLFRPLDRTECRRRLGWPTDRRVVLFPAHPARPIKQYSLASAAVELLKSKSGLPVELRTLSNVAPGSVPVYMNAADCVLITSAWEAGPIALTEALACGVPVVTVPVGYAAGNGAVRDAVRVVSPQPECIARALEEVIVCAPPRERSRAWEFQSELAYGDRIVRTYREALKL
jgi:teichuronic acid biosynthesis glycosyltransferase TuaC